MNSKNSKALVSVFASLTMLATPVLAVDSVSIIVESERAISQKPKTISAINAHGVDRTYSTEGFID
ncbi:MAG: hypothetical protein ABL863_09790, partial [Nitrosomonas sp.]